jgi:DNA invertase Pin-like site-specific DNA recombinase
LLRAFYYVVDTSAKNPMAEMQLGMMAVFAQFERAIIVERVNAGLAAARKTRRAAWQAPQDE